MKVSLTLLKIYKDKSVSLEAPSLMYQFMQITLLVCVGEIGDRSQISIIYIANQSSFNLVLAAIIISNLLLSISSILCGQLLASRFSIRKLTLISGFLFVGLGLIAFLMTLIEDFGILNNKN